VPFGTDARLIYSLWPGYLERGKHDFRDWCSEHRIDFEIQHTSGHAGISDMKKLVEALLPRKIVPIHSAATDRFSDFFSDVEQKEDGAWWAI
jgi:ribonuclease J